ncbi:kinase-like domain-containing protein, partial [Mycena polygramma]
MPLHQPSLLSVSSPTASAIVLWGSGRYTSFVPLFSPPANRKTGPTRQKHRPSGTTVSSPSTRVLRRPAMLSSIRWFLRRKHRRWLQSRAHIHLRFVGVDLFRILKDLCFGFSVDGYAYAQSKAVIGPCTHFPAMPTQEMPPTPPPTSNALPSSSSHALPAFQKTPREQQPSPSSSPPRSSQSSAQSGLVVTIPADAPSSAWWGRSIQTERPWSDPVSAAVSGTRNANSDDEASVEVEEGSAVSAAPAVPKEQTEGWERTRQRIAEALIQIVPPAVLIAHNLLQASTEVLQFVPIPGLGGAACLLLNIWDNVQGVDTNRLACLRLAERCANLLLSVVHEVHEEGDKVEQELTEPLQKLVQTFTYIRDFLIKQARRPFLMRYLKREETLGDIARCNTLLTDALSMFSLSVQMRILRQVKETEDRREAENRALFEALARGHHQDDAPGLTVDKRQLTPRQTLPALPAESEHANVVPAICTLQSTQNTLDFEHDAADLRALLRDALAQSNDVDMLRVLQVGRAEMSEALRTMQRTLESVDSVPSAESLLPPTPPGDTPHGKAQQQLATFSSSDSGDNSGAGLTMPHDTLDSEFIASGIDALQRMSGGGETLPSWTITRYEVERDTKIGTGRFGDVYKGVWAGRTVAIKCLTKATPREVFLRQIEVWKELKHPNVLGLFGASAACSDGPWFFVCPYQRFGNLSSFLGRVEQEGEVVHTGRVGDLLRFMHEIAKGMEYLFDKRVIHGDFRAAHVLVDDRVHCLISGFGQSEMKSEVYRTSGTAPRTLRWYAPERLLGSSDLTPQMDIYSYAICCVEILSMGRIPWPTLSDEAVRNLVLKDNTRPKIPSTRFDSPALHELLRSCWDKDPAIRPPFSKIVKVTQQLRRAA